MKQKDNGASQSNPSVEMSLADLAGESGLTERTIRYYISRGLLDGPARGGRGAFYTNEHLKRLREIRQSQAEGRTLTEIERQANAEDALGRLPEPQAWRIYALADDIVVQVKSGTSPWRQHQVRSALERLARELSPVDEMERKDKKP